MPTRDEILRKETFKEDGLAVDVRVFYTLALSGQEMPDDRKERSQLHRTTKAVALLTRQLRDAGILSDAQIDDMLFESLS